MLTQASELVALERSNGEIALTSRAGRPTGTRRRLWLAGRSFTRPAQFDFDSEMTR